MKVINKELDKINSNIKHYKKQKVGRVEFTWTQ